MHLTHRLYVHTFSYKPDVFKVSSLKIQTFCQTNDKILHRTPTGCFSKTTEPWFGFNMLNEWRFPFFCLHLTPTTLMLSGQRAAEWADDSPLTVRCTQLPLWKVLYCFSNINTLHSYQPWSSERTGSIWREAFPCREALPADREGQKEKHIN